MGIFIYRYKFKAAEHVIYHRISRLLQETLIRISNIDSVMGEKSIQVDNITSILSPVSSINKNKHTLFDMIYEFPANFYVVTLRSYGTSLKHQFHSDLISARIFSSQSMKLFLSKQTFLGLTVLEDAIHHHRGKLNGLIYQSNYLMSALCLELKMNMLEYQTSILLELLHYFYY